MYRLDVLDHQGMSSTYILSIVAIAGANLALEYQLLTNSYWQKISLRKSLSTQLKILAVSNSLLFCDSLVLIVAGIWQATSDVQVLLCIMFQ